jgi:phosphoenolpyruvate-protein phosphotransferase (PTS system enzyme I)
MAELRLEGRSASGGLAFGPLALLSDAAFSARACGSPEEEAAALKGAVSEALGQLERLLGQSEGDGADILAFQIAMLEDPELGDPAFAAIDEGSAADAAWRSALAVQIRDYESSSDAHFQARAADLRDIRDRVLEALLGAPREQMAPCGAILLARDLTPSRFLSADWSRGGGIALTEGSATSHVATLARARGIPMIVGLNVDLLSMQASREALIDGDGATLWIDPAPSTRKSFAAKSEAARRAAEAAAAFRLRPALTSDGIRIAVLLNVADPAELETLDPVCCDGIGLVRTEFLFEGASAPPDEETQYIAYRRLAEWAAGKPVTIRTLDAGADKPIAWLPLERESNPFLGLRGIRLSLARPEIFRVQLRALCRAAAHGQIEVMLPMVAIVDELVEARRILDEEFVALQGAGVASRRPALGIMVETPAAAITTDAFDAAFYSIGSNDLTQYVMAAARDSEAVAALNDVSRPAVMRLIASVAAHGAAVGRKVSLCGDAAGNPRLVQELLAAGLRALSVSPAALDRTKEAIASADLSGGPR